MINDSNSEERALFSSVEKIQKTNDRIQDALTVKDYKLKLSNRKSTPPRSHQLPKLNP
jgi:hypothetical protein